MQETPTHIRRGIRIFTGLILFIGVFLIGIYVGYENRPAMAKVVGLVHKEAPEAITADTDFGAFWKAWQLVDQKFPGAEDTENDTRLYGAIKGLLASFGDPYTTFFPPAENEIFESQIAGEFSGVGIEIDQKEGVLIVVAPLKGTPADAAGIEPGDKILKIDDTITADITIDGAIQKIRGEAGTKVTLTILRDGVSDPKVFTLTRATISLPTVDTDLRPDGVFVISLYNFSAHSSELFRNALREYLSSGSKKLIVDLRGNPGGYLNAAVDIASLFLPEGKVVVKEIGKTAQDETVHMSSGSPIFPQDSKLIILVDQGSASASEILAGALSEHGIATLVGTKTFGKGSVQEVVKLTPDTSLKITVAKWYTPEGHSISENGLEPKVEIKRGEGTIDTQLEGAVELFKAL